MNFETENIEFKLQQGSSKQIRRMIKESDGNIFEKNRSLEQDLTYFRIDMNAEK